MSGEPRNRLRLCGPAAAPLWAPRREISKRGSSIFIPGETRIVPAGAILVSPGIKITRESISRICISWPLKLRLVKHIRHMELSGYCLVWLRPVLSILQIQCFVITPPPIQIIRYSLDSSRVLDIHYLGVISNLIERASRPVPGNVFHIRVHPHRWPL